MDSPGIITPWLPNPGFAGSGVTAKGIDLLASGNWSQAVFRFSDNTSDVVEYPVYNAGISGLEPAHFTASAENNPFTGTLNIAVSCFSIPLTSTGLHFQRVKSLLNALEM